MQMCKASLSPNTFLPLSWKRQIKMAHAANKTCLSEWAIATDYSALGSSSSLTVCDRCHLNPVKPIPGSRSPRSCHNLRDWTHGSRWPRLCPSRLLSITGPGAQVLPGVPILILKAKGNCRNLIFHSKCCSNPMFVQITSGSWREPKTWGNVLSLSEFHFLILTNQGHFRKNTSALFVPG